MATPTTTTTGTRRLAATLAAVFICLHKRDTGRMPPSIGYYSDFTYVGIGFLSSDGGVVSGDGSVEAIRPIRKPSLSSIASFE